MLAIATAALAAVIFTIDTIVVLDIAVATLYVVVVLSAARFCKPRGLVLVGVGCVGLSIISWALVPPTHPTAETIINECISMASIGLVTALALHAQKAVSTLRNQASLLDLSHDPVFSRRMDGKILYWNRGAEVLYGFKRAEALGAVAHTLLQTTFVTPIEQIMSTLLREGHWEGELINRKADGTSVVVTTRWSLQRDNAGQPSLILETSNDVSERKRMEDALQQARSDLARLNRVLVAGEMTASIAHEVNQPIAAVVTNAHAGLRWLNAQPPTLEEVRQALTRIAEDGRRAGEVVSRVRALFRKVPPRIERWDLNESIGEAATLTRPELLRNGVVLRRDFSDGVLLVKGDRVQVQQVLINLIVNAVESMNEVHDRPRELTIRTAKVDSGIATIEARDTGAGFEPAHLDRLFQPFYTTKAEGIGLGLAISRSIVEAHGGRLEAAPNKPHGAIFRFTLPTEKSPCKSGGTAFEQLD
ncbi:Adaptive-response sensory-kinase SasA [Paraburkholderia solisilvae]|uniref:histidine kinase n=2 Tax=Paraburkholderia solisilvae TaxID=624376 RepID=A0A6J5EUT9_9BURK|nr:Adaptive-response sensory-kinase SasA [Paraburkholderia solisilvae]